MTLYQIYNGAAPTTADLVAVDTGTAIKTMLQIKLEGSSRARAKIVEWGISFDGASGAAGIQCGLLTTGAIKATITEHLAAGIVDLDAGADTVTDANPFDFTAAADGTGYTATAEGSITASRLFDAQIVQPNGQFVKQWPLGREPSFPDTDYLRIRVTAPAAVNAICYVVIEV